MINIGVVGYGYWGPNLVRNFSKNQDSTVTVVSDLSEANRNKAAADHNVKTTEDYLTVVTDPDIDAVVIATPVYSHFEIAQKALSNGKHVLLEKPMASTVEECQILNDLADEKGLVLMVDHTFLYTGAVQQLAKLIKNDHLGELMYLDSTRINLGLLQPDINVLWDLAPHDLSILLHLIKGRPKSVQATGISHTSNGIENIAYMTVNFEEGFIAHFNCSWTSPVKIRQMLIGGNKKMIVYNDMEPTEKIKIYDSGFDVRTDDEKRNILVDYRVGDIHTPKVDMKEALSGLAIDFTSAILDSSYQPISSKELGLTVVKILEASNESLKQGGAEIML